MQESRRNLSPRANMGKFCGQTVYLPESNKNGGWAGGGGSNIFILNYGKKTHRSTFKIYQQFPIVLIFSQDEEESMSDTKVKLLPH